MGSFGGVKFDAQNFEQTVQSAEQKKIIEEQLKEQYRVDKLAQSLIDYRVGLLNSTFPDGQYYVTADFNSQLVRFQGDARPMDGMDGMPPPVIRNFKKGEIVNVVTFTKDMAMNTVKVIKTDTGNFYADQNNLSKTKPAEPVITESKDETKRRNGYNTKIMIVVAFILGYLLSKE
jgi:Na+-translocating ferredoxin:NAD+ oxidoreductase RnfG subunit